MLRYIWARCDSGLKNVFPLVCCLVYPRCLESLTICGGSKFAVSRDCNDNRMTRIQCTFSTINIPSMKRYPRFDYEDLDMVLVWSLRIAESMFTISQEILNQQL